MNELSRFSSLLPSLNGLVEILVLAVLIYYVFLFFQGSRGAQVLSGFVILFLGLLGLTNALELDALNWLLQRFTVYIAVAFLIVFQPEIRRALAELGRRKMFAGAGPDRTVVDALVDGVTRLADGKIGALVAIERQVGMAAVLDTGTLMDALVSPELLQTLFYPNTLLHDGGVVIRGGRIVAAGCVFPLSHKTELNKQLGTRHRAAIGLTEETDALVLVVSEETGAISMAYKGRLRRGLDREKLERFLESILLRPQQRAERASGSRVRRWMGTWRWRPRQATPAVREADHAT